MVTKMSLHHCIGVFSFHEIQQDEDIQKKTEKQGIVHTVQIAGEDDEFSHHFFAAFDINSGRVLDQGILTSLPVHIYWLFVKEKCIQTSPAHLTG